jgi:3-deoxy-D-manno-octulosonic-acid transferase
MSLTLYRGLSVAAGPLIGLYLRRRRSAGKEDTARFGERLGRAGKPRPPGPLVWVHAASVGEAVSVVPLIGRVLDRRGDANILITTGTVTSARLMADRLPARAVHQYVPVDRPDAVRRFLDHWRPDLALWIESEFWPNLLGDTQARGVPCVLVNARMSERSFARWRRFGGLIAPLLAGFELCLAQDSREAERLRLLGAGAVRTAGNLKSAAAALPADEAALGRLEAETSSRPVVVAASTHPGEEAIVGAAHRALSLGHPDLLTIVVPRHPARGEAIAAELRAAGLEVAMRSRDDPIGAGTDVYLGDTLGELGLFYRVADVAFVGGSLVPHGGQNPLEPARLGCAVVHGPHTFNFRAVADAFAAVGATTVVHDADDLASAVDTLLGDAELRERRANLARAAAEAEAEALDRVAAEIAPFVDALPHGKADNAGA